jgi:predicted nucleic acid-binding protein
MNDKSFIDTNVVIYAFSSSDTEKRKKALKLFLKESSPMVSIQVLNEFCNIQRKKYKIKFSDIKTNLELLMEKTNLHSNSFDDVSMACDISERYHYSYYDSLIISSALNNNCNILYSEDMQNNQVIENRLTIINPFAIE